MGVETLVGHVACVIDKAQARKDHAITPQLLVAFSHSIVESSNTHSVRFDYLTMNADFLQIMQNMQGRSSRYISFRSPNYNVHLTRLEKHTGRPSKLRRPALRP
jgi:hypothetical protein